MTMIILLIFLPVSVNVQPKSHYNKPQLHLLNVSENGSLLLVTLAIPADQNWKCNENKRVMIADINDAFYRLIKT